MLPLSPESTERLLQIYKRRVDVLHEQKAKFGSFIPPHIEIELEDAEKTIKELENLSNRRQISIQEGNLQFQNQIDAVNAIINQRQIGSFVIDAPAGYGKTYLLEELRLRLVQDGWYVRLLSFRKSKASVANQQGAIDFICDSLGIQQATEPSKVGYAVANTLRTKTSGTLGDVKGAFLLLDSAELMFRDRLESPYTKIKQFFAGLNKASADFDNFRVRVIVAGRYIVDDRLMAIDVQPIQLKVFDLNIVQQAVDSYLEDRQNRRKHEWNEEFAKHVMYVTGGHPQMIRQLLTTEFENYTTAIDLEHWITAEKKNIEEHIITPTIAEIRKDIPDGDALWEDLLRLCVFRKFNKQIIRDLFPQRIEKPFQYTDRLERYGLVTRDESFYKDGVLRPAMVRWLQFTDNSKLASCCGAAYAIFEQQLLHPSYDGFRPPAIVRELLYVHLLELHPLALTSDTRMVQLEQAKLQEKMLGYVGQLRQLSDDYDIEELIYDLRRALLSDGEIRFLYNYLFRYRGEAGRPSGQPDFAGFVHDICGNHYGGEPNS